MELDSVVLDRGQTPWNAFGDKFGEQLTRGYFEIQWSELHRSHYAKQKQFCQALSQWGPKIPKTRYQDVQSNLIASGITPVWGMFCPVETVGDWAWIERMIQGGLRLTAHTKSPMFWKSLAAWVSKGPWRNSSDWNVAQLDNALRSNLDMALEEKTAFIAITTWATVASGTPIGAKNWENAIRQALQNPVWWDLAWPSEAPETLWEIWKRTAG